MHKISTIRIHIMNYALTILALVFFLGEGFDSAHIMARYWVGMFHGIGLAFAELRGS